MTHPGPYPPEGGPPPQYRPPGQPPYHAQPYPQPYQPQPYYPQPGPPPGFPPRRRGGRGWLLAGAVAALVLVLGLGVVGLYVLTKDDRTATTATPKTAAKQYATPPDRCTLLDASQVEGWAGKPTGKEPEKSSFPANLGGDVDGCSYDVQLETLNTLKIFVATDGHAKERYGHSLTAFKAIPSVVTKPVSGLGTEAAGYTQQGADKRRIQAGLAMYDNNLFLEIRFIAGGTRPWSADEVERNLVGLARAVVAKIPTT